MLEQTEKLDYYPVESLNCVLHGVVISFLNTEIILKIHSFVVWPEFTHCIDTLNGTNEQDSLCPGLA